MSDRAASFGAQLRRYRERRGLSQEELAERAGLTARGISALERGERRPPDPHTARTLVEALGLRAEEREAFLAATRPAPTRPEAPPSGDDRSGYAVAPAAESPLQLQLLGGFRVSVDGRAVPGSAWRSRTAKHLVKLLGLAPHHRLHRDQVLEHLWPEVEPGTAGNRLHQALYVARRILEPEAPRPDRFLQFDRDEHVVLSPLAPVAVDVEAFEFAADQARRGRDPAAYQAAIDLYVGELLPDDRYEGWIRERRDALREIALGLLLGVAGLHQQRGALEPAIAALQRALTIEPSHEGAHTALMRLYASSGRRRQALRQYALLRESLRRELDAAPDPASDRLYQAILTGDVPQTAADGAERPIGVHAFQRSEPGRVTGLPSFLTSFVGRRREMVEICGLLGTTRLLTLAGAGGCGKTRLAIQAATEVAEDFPDGVWLVELAGISRPDLAPRAVASALRVPEQAGRPVADSLVAAMRRRELLLLLDNCEHLVDACARLAEQLVQGCPRIRILATSREPLRVLGEVTWRVPSLSTPGGQRVSSADVLLRSEAVQLFLDRARAVVPGFVLTDEEAPAVAQICSRLDGIPLAIELAAARVRVLTVNQIAARLDDCFRLLTNGSRTAPSRQQTLAATLDWSYDLLTDPEATLFRRLAAFRGGCGLEALDEVCGGDGIAQSDLLDLLTDLVDKSLVLVAEMGDESRYRLLEPIRQYARLRLRACAEAQAIEERHRDWCLRLAERAAPELWQAKQAWWLDRLATEHDNLRGALGWSLSEPGQAEPGLRLAGALWPFWLLRGHVAEGRQWLDALLTRISEPVASRVNALLGEYALAIRHGDAVAARVAAAASLATSEALGDQRGASRALHNLGVLDWLLGDYTSAGAYFDESLRRAQEVGDDVGTGIATHSLGILAWSLGDTNRAGDLLRASLALMDRGGAGAGFPAPILNQGWMERWGTGGSRRLVIEESLVLFRPAATASAVGQVLINLGNLARAQGDLGRARPLLEEALALFGKVGDGTGVGLALAQLGCLAAWAGDHDRARTLLEESLASRRAVGDQRGIGMTLASLGRLAAATGDLDQAQALLDESLTHFQEIADKPGIAIALGELGILKSESGDDRRAESLLQESLSAFRQLGGSGVKLGVALCLRDLGLLAHGRGDGASAHRHLEASLALFQRLGDRHHAALLRDDLARLTGFVGSTPDGASPTPRADHDAETGLGSG